MAYPVDKETFRRVVNQELPAVPGDVVDEDDQNLPADFLERLQDTFGYNIKMGYASVKDFFNDLITKGQGLKKFELINFANGLSVGIKNAGTHEELGHVEDFLATDVVFFQALVNWRRYENTVAKIDMRIQRNGSGISSLWNYDGLGNHEMLCSSLDWIYLTPAAGSATYELRINISGGQVHLTRITFTAIKISI